MSELGTDIALAGLAISFNTWGPNEARYGRAEFPTQRADDRAYRATHGPPTKGGTTPREARFRELSNATVVGAAAMPALLAFAGEGPQLQGRLLTTVHALLLTNAVATSIKYAVRRPRPEARFHEDISATGDNALSFPSGHSAMAFAGATTAVRLLPATPMGIKVTGFLLAGVTSYARMAGGKHFLTDVFAGAAIGSGAALTAASWHSDAENAEMRGVAIVVHPGGIGLKTSF